MSEWQAKETKALKLEKILHLHEHLKIADEK